MESMHKTELAVSRMLQSLIGLDHLKGLVLDIQQQQALIQAASLPPRERSWSELMVFTGNPGTGKSTAAHLFGELYRHLGLLERGHVHSVHAMDLIGDVYGQTHRLTDTAVDRAMDGVLYIDEAHFLDPVGEDPFASEALDCLRERMIQEPDRLVIILSDYPAKMRVWLAADPGFAIRTQYRVSFPDYEPEELYAILTLFLNSRRISVSEEMEVRLRDVVTNMYNNRGPYFHNARSMRRLANGLIRNWETRLSDNAEQTHQ